MEGGQSGTYQRLTIGVVGSAGERHEDVEMKQKSEACEQKHRVLRVQ